MTDHAVVSDDDWLEARRALLAKEKEFTRLRDRISEQRRAMPWRKIEKDYRFQTTDGEKTLADLFGGHSQLIVQHFMFGPDWEEGCKSCSFMADHMNPSTPHLEARDVALVAVSNGPLDRLQTFKTRMGWEFEWVSSMGDDFNFDFNVSYTPEELESGEVTYNYARTSFPGGEAPGISCFYKDADGQIFHTYSTFGRGLDIFIGAYNLLDIAPLGRNEQNLQYTMEWVRHHDRYE
jgi:predicted dithiol-disulfide oxidoreductase (DUF899 family)